MKSKPKRYVMPRARREPGTMNNTERKYAEQLDKMQKTGQIISYQYEAVKLRLAHKTFYTPDFFVTHHDRFEFVEIKGFCEDDAMVKFKTAAAMFPGFQWRMIKWKNKQWEIIYEL